MPVGRSEEHTSELQSQSNLVCRLLLEKKKHRVETEKVIAVDQFEIEQQGQRLADADIGEHRTAGVENKVLGNFRQTCFHFFFNDTATTEIYTLSLHDALPISRANNQHHDIGWACALGRHPGGRCQDRKSTRLNSSHSQISYAVFCLKKQN